MSGNMTKGLKGLKYIKGNRGALKIKGGAIFKNKETFV